MVALVIYLFNFADMSNKVAEHKNKYMALQIFEFVLLIKIENISVS